MEEPAVKTRALAHTLPADLSGVGAVQIDTKVGFKLKGHEKNPELPLSPIFLNLRTPDNPKPGPLTPELVGKIGWMLWQHAKATGLKFQAVAGLPNAGTPLAKAFKQAAYEDGMYLPCIELGKTTTENSRRIEGIIDTDGAELGCTVLVIDDLITGADSKIEGIEELVKGFFVVTDVLVVVDREQGGSAELQKRGIRLHYLFTLRFLVNELFKAGEISLDERDKVINYLGG